MKPSKKIGQLLETEPMEALHEVKNAVLETGKNEAAATIDTLWNQLLGVKETPSHHMSGDLQEGQAIDFSAHKKPQEQAHHATEKAHEPKRVEVAAAIDYRSEILQGERRISHETEQMLSRQIEEIVIELRQLVNASQQLQAEFHDVAVDQHITKPGKYHVSLFSFILSIVKNARQKVESSSTCLSISKGRKKKQGYWDMFEDQGTSFSMNNERAIATQAG